MSKRAGTVITLDDLVEAIGVDAARYALARASVDQQIDIDIDLWTRKTNDNPVFYVQYAHARISSVLRNAAELGLALGAPDDVDAGQLVHERENDLLRAIAEFPRVLTGAAELRAPHRVARYLEELAGTYHRFYDVCRVLPRGDEEADPADHGPAVAVRGHRGGAAQRPRRARRERSGADVTALIQGPQWPFWPLERIVRAHPAGPLHGNIAQPTAAGAPPADLGALDPHVWPRSAQRVDGELHIGGRPVTELAREHGTPLFVLDEVGLPRPRRRVRRRLRRTPTCTTRRRRSCAARSRAGSPTTACTSTPAAATSWPLALAAGFPPERIALHGNNKSLVELQLAVEAGIGHIVVDSFDEIDRLVPLAAARVAAGGSPVPVLIRATVGIEAHTHEFIATAHEDQKFGFSLATGDALTAAVRGHPRAARCELAGLHSHIGSQIFDTAGFEAAAHRVVGLLGADPPGDRRGARRAQPRRRLRHRLPVRGRPGQPGRRRRRGCARSSPPSAPSSGLPVPRLAVEPGRAIAGPGTVTLYEIGTIKPVRLGASGAPGTPLVRNYVSVDGGMSDNIRTALYDASYTCVLANRQLRRPAGAVPGRRQALRERRHPGPRPVAALRRRARRPARGRRDRRLLLVDGEQLQLPAQAAGGRRPGRRGHRDRAASDTVRRVRPRRRPRRGAHPVDRARS